MDAPPNKEDCGPFIAIAEAFINIGLNVPAIIEQDLQQGFLLLSDLGSQLYLNVLTEQTVDRLYGDALGALATLQGCGVKDGLLPAYGHTLLMNEMQLFHDWLLDRHCDIKLDSAEQASLQEVFELLADNALQQPQVCVHRDYHSRNLMQVQNHNPGMLDFQDAVIGPVTYDLVSLLRDCYIAWPRERVENWVIGYHELAMQTGIMRPTDCNEQQFLRWFDLMGVQRHLKAAGIFARLRHRDNKAGYMKDVPRTLGYVSEVCERYDELQFLGLIVGRVNSVLNE
jgi:aminoglycoside/choline kinase family phosphotransferase